MKISTNILGKRVQEFRKRMKLTQKELAVHMGFSSSETISQIERNEREIKAWELSELANALAVNVNDLLQEEKPEKEPAILWRQTPKNQKETKEAVFIKRCRRYALLEKLSGMEVSRIFPQKHINPDSLNFETADQMAMEIRNEFNLGERPAEVLGKTLEDVFGVKIWYLQMEDGSAASTIGKFGPAILINSNEAPWRRNYNFAHELFHLITWNSIPPAMIHRKKGLWDRIEKIANAFASALLLPNEALTIEFNKHLKKNRISYTNLIGIARNFGVSTSALLYRLLNMKRITQKMLDKTLEDPKFKNIDRASMSGRWWPPPEIPERFVRLAVIAFKKGNLSRTKLSELLDTSLVDLPDTLKEYGFDDNEGSDAEVRVS